ncbi:V-type proton ATPase subunit e [Exaiptasia diaphana]|nr:V-type proton ATPase subunit e [Exaiptasia diaphana]
MANHLPLPNDGSAKGSAAIPVIIVTVFWLIVGAVVPCFIRGKNKSLIQTMLVLTAVCCWIFWLCCYLSQLNPLIGPSIDADVLKDIVKEWGRRTTA